MATTPSLYAAAHAADTCYQVDSMPTTEPGVSETIVARTSLKYGESVLT